MEAIVRACGDGKLPAEVAIVLSDKEGARILGRACEYGIRAEYLSPGPYQTKLGEEAEAKYVAILHEARVDMVVLAGFMRVLKGDFLRAFPGRIVNIHPSLLPSFPGLEAWRQALEYGVKVTGVTVHLVDQGIDTGTILGQRVVSIYDDDTPESLHQRIQAVEWELYPEVIGALLGGEYRFQGRRAIRG